jgi:hypothetical protein
MRKKRKRNRRKSNEIGGIYTFDQARQEKKKEQDQVQII